MILSRPPRLAPFVIALLLAARPAFAGCGEFDRSFERVWRFYQLALFATSPRHADPAAAARALSAWLESWPALIGRWSDRPPPCFADDRAFGARLEEMAAVGLEAKGWLDRGRPDQAFDRLSLLGALAADLRRRDGLIAYDDRLDAFDEALSTAEAIPIDEEQLSAETTALLLEEEGVLAFVIETLEKSAPAALAGDAAFIARLSALAQTLAGLRVAILEGRGSAARAALFDLRLDFDRMRRDYG